MHNALPLSAASLSHALSQSLDCVKLLDLDGNLLWMNDGGLCTMEIDALEDVVGCYWPGFWPGDGLGHAERSLEVSLREGVARFSGFCPTAKGARKWWDVSVHPVHDEGGVPIGFLSTSRDVTEREEQRVALETVVAEMHHRLRNSYTIVSSLMHSLTRGDPALTEFADQFQQRIAALAAAQSFVGPDSPDTLLKDLLATLVEPFRAHPGVVITLKTDRIALLDKRIADAVALCIGEFGVNSTKYGAIGNGGEIAVSAAIDGEILMLAWEETSAAPVTGHSREGGQGLRIMERILAASAGSLDLRWKTHGLDALITFQQGFRQL